MKKAKNVNFKSVNKNTQLYDNAPPRERRWFKCSVFFKNRVECKNFSMPLALKLRIHCPNVYFARYCDVTQSRTDFIFELPDRSTVNFAISLLDHLEERQFKTNVPLPCEGSLPHARGFDAVLEIWTKTFGVATNEEVEFDFGSAQRTAWTTLADVLHWQCNMLGLDYCDEAKLSLYGLERIINIFQASIKEGNKLSDISTRLSKKRSRTTNN
jgi:hypothetical protein